ncbi:hypothetical protein CJ030_MR8G010740 [Morella rubra]|uniref:Uncharacterized protein n=1 Tax=Morella rubra TaxID=262757 RepID=A0A6A1UPW0_9ROSI|nr:hypothetical protein CJ030_MR8G010740 [Morella rubra]
MARQLLPVFVHQYLLLSAGEAEHVGSLGEESWVQSEKISVHIPEGECGGVTSTAATLLTKVECMKREQEQECMGVEHEEHMQKEQEHMRKEQERLRAEISKELEKKMSSVIEKKMSDMSKRLFSQFGGSKR